MADTPQDDDVGRLLAQQSGLVTTAQLRRAGLPVHILRRRLQRQWRYVLPRVVQAGREPLTGHQRLVAAVLFAGDGAVVSGVTAALWHGVRSAALDRSVHVTIPADRCVGDQAFVVVHRSTRPDETAWDRDGVPVSSPARAVADAARQAGEPAARAIVLEAVQRRLVAVPSLRHELVAGPRAGAAALRRALAEAEQGAWSVPEADLARLVHDSPRLPVMWANPRLTAGGHRLPTPDGWFDDVALAVQVHSRQYHAGELDWEATVSADSAFAEHGIPVVAVTPRQISRTPADVVGRLERATPLPGAVRAPASWPLRSPHEASRRRFRPARRGCPTTPAGRRRPRAA